MVLLRKFKRAYTDHLDEGLVGPSPKGDPRDAVLGDPGVRPNVEIWNSTEEEEEEEEEDNLRWYRYLFLTHSKPSTHLRALSHVDPDDLAQLPNRLERLFDRIKQAVVTPA